MSKPTLRKWILSISISLTTVFLAACSTHTQHYTEQIVFQDVPSQTRQFISYFEQIQLTPAQEAIKQQALVSLPAPCCDKYPMSRCCCACNLARSVWGLSSHLIANLDYDAAQVRTTVEDWITFTNPAGYSGQACQKNQCNAPFEEDGCGGMEAQHLVL